MLSHPIKSIAWAYSIYHIGCALYSLWCYLFFPGLLSYLTSIIWAYTILGHNIPPSRLISRYWDHIPPSRLVTTSFQSLGFHPSIRHILFLELKLSIHSTATTLFLNIGANYLQLGQSLYLKLKSTHKIGQIPQSKLITFETSNRPSSNQNYPEFLK